MWLRPTVQPTVYQQDRVCERRAHKYPPTHRHAHTHTPEGASVMVMAKGCHCLRD